MNIKVPTAEEILNEWYDLDETGEPQWSKQ